LILLVFLSIADYALYSAKRNAICHGIDYAVCAAIQEIDTAESEEGLATGYDEETGKTLVDGIVINERKSDNAFFSTLQSNTGVSPEAVRDKTLVVITSPNATGLDYKIHMGEQEIDGTLQSQEQLENVINSAVRQFWNGSQVQDRQVIYVNGNPKTNGFKNVPYYMVFMKDLQINGLFKRRTATFVGFAGAKMERQK
jgi:hypothetical protein